jgi:hypothetical protein
MPKGSTPITHAVSRVIEAGAVSQCCPDSDGHGALAPTQGLEGLDHRGQTPGFDLLPECPFEPLQAFGVLSHGTDVGPEDAVWRGGGPDDFGEPAPMGRAPGRSAGITDIRPQQNGVETNLRGLELPDGIFTGAAQMPAGFIRDRGDIAGRALA